MGALHPLLTSCFRSMQVDTANLSSKSGALITNSHTDETYYVKVDKVAQIRAEAESLRAMALTAPLGLIPRLYAVEESDDGTQAGMVSEYFDLGSKARLDQRKLGRQLAHMHRPPLDGASGYTGKFGFECPTFCGVTKQSNEWEDSWATFYLDRMLGPLALKAGKEVAEGVEKLEKAGIRRLFEGLDIQPVIIHGDLWSGNVGVNKSTGDPVLYDPSSFWGHHEFDLGMTRMFGGFTAEFYDAYHEVLPRSKPYSVLQSLYELYHHVNHTAMFGGSYQPGALKQIDHLLALLDHC